MVGITVCLIAHNSARTLEACLRSIQDQSRPFREILVLDNASSDDSASLLKSFPGIEVIESPDNVGFAAGFNRLFARATGEWILLVNPDVKLARDFQERSARILEQMTDESVGMISPKILRARGPRLEPTDVLDSAGISWTFLFRHVDAGSNDKDTGQYDEAAWVFGPTGAAALYRRRALEAVALDGQVLDERFFAYREDVDLAFRLQWKGFRCLYQPEVTAWHERQVLSERRRRLPPALNYHSLKNRQLLRFKNLTGILWLLLLPTTVFYELFILLYCLLFERTSLSAYVYAVLTLRSSQRWRRHTLNDRRVSSWYMFAFFCGREDGLRNEAWHSRQMRRYRDAVQKPRRG